MKFLLFSISMLFLIIPQIAYGIEISAEPEKILFGPNEWIKIFVEVEGYSGGDIIWTVTQPDGNTVEGVFSNIQASKVTQTISRNASDNQFGTWEIQYEYKGVLEKINVEVEPLVISVTTDKQSYIMGETTILRFSTNQYSPTAANAENMITTILDSNRNPIQSVEKIKTKVYQPVMIQHFTIEELLQNSSFGIFHATIEYYGITQDVSFEIKNADTDTTIFLSSDKPVYLPNEQIELSIIMPKISESSGKLDITLPSGQLISKSIAITESLTRVILEDVNTSKNGTYSLQFEYGTSKITNSFEIYDKNQEIEASDLEIGLKLDKPQYRPGEIIQAAISANKISNKQIIYWFEDSSGKKGQQFSFTNPTLGTFVISHIIPTDFIQGPSKLYIKYGSVESFAFFFVSGEVIATVEKDVIIQHKGPEILVTLDNKITNFAKNTEVLITSDNKDANFAKITDISISPNQEIFVLDSGDKKIKILDSDGNLKKSWSMLDDNKKEITNPTSVFTEKSFVHITDSNDSRIITFDNNGNFIKDWGNSGIDYKSMKNPTGITKDNSGIYFVSDGNQNKILKYDKNGDYAGEVNSLLTASAKFASIKSITSNGDSIFLLSEENNRILQFSKNGGFIKSFGTEGQGNKQFQNPTSLQFANDEYLYVTDSGNSRVIIMNTQGEYIDKWGTFGNGPGQFQQMVGIDIDSEGNVWVAENNRIQKFESISKIQSQIPEWVKNNAGWWAEDSIDETAFVSGIQYLIKEEIIPISGKTQTTGISEEIPQWVKNNAGWWAEGIISEDDFINGIKYLVEKGIIHIS